MTSKETRNTKNPFVRFVFDALDEWCLIGKTDRIEIDANQVIDVDSRIVIIRCFAPRKHNKYQIVTAEYNAMRNTLTVIGVDVF